MLSVLMSWNSLLLLSWVSLLLISGFGCVNSEPISISKFFTGHNASQRALRTSKKFKNPELVENRVLPYEVENHPNWSLLDDKEVPCGESSSDRIIGGVEAQLGQFPWIARLGYLPTSVVLDPHYARRKQRVWFMCGGSLISPVYVLTAAHCIETEGFSLVNVRLGEHDENKQVDCDAHYCSARPQDIEISSVSSNSRYNDPAFSNDVALVRLAKKADYNGWVSPVCLPRAPYSLPPKEGLEVAGWGVVDVPSERSASQLQVVKVPVVSLQECQQQYGAEYQLGEEQLCAGGQKGYDACNGDSGGPLMQVDDNSGFPRYQQVGVVSFGPSECGSSIPGVYANTSHHLKWILDQLQP